MRILVDGVDGVHFLGSRVDVTEQVVRRDVVLALSGGREVVGSGD